MGSRKNRLENETSRRSEAATAANAAKASRQSLTAQVDAVLAKNKSARLTMSATLHTQLSDYISGVRENTAGFITGLTETRRVMTVDQALALANADADRRKQANNDLLQRRNYLLALLDLDFSTVR
ncbi:MAG: hypothetical protein WCP79_03300 [Bacillota bacterium]